jgi:hypothetical protein
MPENLYHVLAFIPATQAWEMPRALEALAQRLISSGKLRINADFERNFARLGEETFTARELNDPTLRPATLARLKRHVSPAQAAISGFANLEATLQRELKKGRGISPEKEAKVARVLVQSAHPSVMELILQTGTEIYVSYSHNVADLVPLHEWKTQGVNSGLQATESAERAAVYVSCGGDPFFEGEQKTYTTDGFPALARMVVIAGQELGHFADLRRAAQGVIGRWSTALGSPGLQADPRAASHRRRDREQLAARTAQYQRAGLAWLRRAEKGLAFYGERRRFSLIWVWYQLWRSLAWVRFVGACHLARLPSKLQPIPAHYTSEAVEAFLADMAYNLAPAAEVYRDDDPAVEEAIAVIEAVARVPQQIHKWGDGAVRFAWPGLHAFYHETVLAAVIARVGQPMAGLAHAWWRRPFIGLRRALRDKPGYYPD